MNPLFGSTEPQTAAPHLRWHVPEDKKEYVGKPLLLAGKPVCLQTHRVGRRTWPCLDQWPKLGKECPHCERAKRSTTWVPLLTVHKPHKLVVLMGGENTWNSVKNLQLRTIVECHYARTLRPTLVFCKETTQLGLLQLRSVMDEEIPLKGDITRWLLIYWQWPQLCEWFGEKYRESIKVRHLRLRAESHGLDLFGSVTDKSIAS